MNSQLDAKQIVARIALVALVLWYAQGMPGLPHSQAPKTDVVDPLVDPHADPVLRDHVKQIFARTPDWRTARIDSLKCGELYYQAADEIERDSGETPQITTTEELGNWLKLSTHFDLGGGAISAKYPELTDMLGRELNEALKPDGADATDKDGQIKSVKLTDAMRKKAADVLHRYGWACDNAVAPIDPG